MHKSSIHLVCVQRHNWYLIKPNYPLVAGRKLNSWILVCCFWYQNKFYPLPVQHVKSCSSVIEIITIWMTWMILRTWPYLTGLKEFLTESWKKLESAAHLSLWVKLIYLPVLMTWRAESLCRPFLLECSELSQK